MIKYKSAHIFHTTAIAGHLIYDVALLETEDFSPYRDTGGSFRSYTVSSINEALDLAAANNVPLYQDGKEIVRYGL